MKRRSRGHISLGNDEATNNEKTPVAMHTLLFNRSNRRSMGSVVVPETPNNSYHSLIADTKTTIDTVFETPDSPEIPIRNNYSNIIEDVSQPTKNYAMDNNLPGSSINDEVTAAEKRDNGEGHILSDEEDDILNITPDLLVGKRRNVMSILESEHTFAQSLLDRKKNSSMINSNNPVYRNVSPVKRRKRRSLAEVILPFDLNDDESLSKKLQAIAELDEPIQAAKDKPSSAKTLKKRSSGMKQNSNIFRSDSCHNSIRIRRDLQVKRLSNVRVETKSEKSNNNTVLFDSEDLELTPINTADQALINHSVGDIIQGLESQNLLESSNMSLCMDDRGSATPTHQNQAHHKYVSTPFRDKGGGQGHEGGNTSMEFAPTQPAMILVLQDVVAYVEFRVGHDNRSEVIKEQLLALGAQVREKLTSDVTHVVFRDGNKATFKRAIKKGLHLVSVLWVEACRQNLRRESEALYPSGSIESYKDPVHALKLRKLKSMQPRDFSEEVRIATARGQRRLKSLKSAGQSPPSGDLGNITPHRNSTGDSDIHSPLFGIAHLLTPKRLRSNSQSSCEEEGSSEDEQRDMTFATPLSKRLYNRFLTPQHDKNSLGRASSGSDISNITSRSYGEASDSNIVSLPRPASPTNVVESQINAVQVGRLNFNEKATAANADSDKSAEVASEHRPINKKYHAVIDKENIIAQITPLVSRRTRRSMRLEQKGIVPEKSDQTNRFEIKSPDSEISTVTDCNRGNNLSLTSCDIPVNLHYANDTRYMGNSNKVKNNVFNSLGVGDVSNHGVIRPQIQDDAHNKERGKGKCNVNNMAKRRSALGNVKKTNLLEKNEMMKGGHDSGATHCDGRGVSENSNLTYESEASCSYNFKSKRHKLFSADCYEPSQELIVPTTPKHEKRRSLGPYANLHAQTIKTHRTAVKELKGHSKSVSLLKKTDTIKQPINKKMERKLLPETLKSNAAAVIGDRPSDCSLLDDVFSSSGDEQLPSKINIVPLPSSRKSIEEFKLRKTLRTRRSSSMKSANSPVFSLCLTSLHSRDIKVLFPIIKKLGKYQIVNDVDSSTTHVICGAERRTLNVLFGIARGCWIIDKSWLYESLEWGKWAPEEPFELFNFCPGAKICRKQREEQGASYKQTLFSGVGSVCVVDGCVPPSHQLRELLELCGCKVVPTVRNANIVVCNASSAFRIRNHSLQITQVSEKWVLDSIQHHQIKTICDYPVVSDGSRSASSSSSSGSISSSTGSGCVSKGDNLDNYMACPQSATRL